MKMRPLKFRAWSRAEKKYDIRGPFDLSSHMWSGYFGDCICGNTDYVIEQFTGLLDRKGLEIYEGDILRLGPKNLVAVEWEISGDDIYEWSGFPFGNKSEIIVGNIHENADLLKKL